MDKFKFKGDPHKIIDFFKFIKQPQTDFENQIYEVYSLKLYDSNEEPMTIELVIHHHTEEEDTATFELTKGSFNVKLSVKSHVDLQLFISTIS